MMRKNQKLFTLIEKSLLDVVQSSTDPEDKSGQVYRLTSHFFVALGELEGLHFTTLFARIAYFSAKFSFSNTLSRALHQFRIEAEKLQRGSEAKMSVEHVYMNGLFALAHAVSIVGDRPVPVSLQNQIPSQYPMLMDVWKQDVDFIRHMRFVATGLSNEADAYLEGAVEQTGSYARLNFGDPGRSDLYQDNVRHAIDVIGFPLMLSLIDIELGADGVMSPRMIVIEPDYLVDVTAVAECFIDSGAESKLHLIKKFMPRVTNGPILLGGIANFFLDELIHDPDVKFAKLLPEVFKLNPVAISLLKDTELRELIKKAESHFINLQSVVKREFPTLGIDASKSFIEPSFYAPLFGIQGRLDLYHIKNNEESEIVELKSGKPFKPNVYGLNSTHYTQTLLYHLLVRSVSDFTVKPSSYILYSSQSADPLRYAPAVSSIQREAIRLRNEIYLIERSAFNRNNSLDQLKSEAFPLAKGFLARDIGLFSNVYGGLSQVEKKYFIEFNRLISGDHFLAKVGLHGSERRNGLASIWLNSKDLKNEQFSILSDLVIDFESSNGKEGAIVMLKGEQTNALANFRKGDIAVLYPETKEERPSAISTQVYKCSIVKIDVSAVHLRLRNKQVSYADLKAHEKWSLEHDLLDSSFQSMHKSLFKFARFSQEKRQKFLGSEPPAQPVAVEGKYGRQLSPHVRNVLQSMINAKDYYLLWGPPGTGKTSVMLSHLVQYYLNDTSENILLLAYTNRAVDEMCLALDNLGKNIRDKYLRIGSRISSGSDFTEQLLSVRMEKISSRRGLMDLLKSQRIVVSTVASFTGAQGVFDLVSLSTVIIDEASQILEPLLAGIIPLFKKAILIGDHKQLPAVVVQRPDKTRVDDPHLHKMHLYNTRASYFERMYSLAVTGNWTWAFGCLYEQGRMHDDIMQFVSEHFYESNLKILPKTISGRDLIEPMHAPAVDSGSTLAKVIMSQRMIFIPNSAETDTPWTKTNDSEACLVVEVVRELSKMYPTRSIGVITPFRAQIANIRAHLIDAGINPDDYTVDTVERYQGSARDVIVLSVCANNTSQLEQVVSLSDEGVDRKLNVAITRAREQFIWTGAPSVLSENALYAKLMAACEVVEVRP